MNGGSDRPKKEVISKGKRKSPLIHGSYMKGDPANLG